MAVQGLGKDRRPAYHEEWANRPNGEDFNSLGAVKPAPASDPYAEAPDNRVGLGVEWTVRDINGGDTHYKASGTGPTSDVNEMDGANVPYDYSGLKAVDIKYE